MAIKSKKVKLSAREKSKIRIRKTVTGMQDKPRLSVFRSSKHTYAQLIIDIGETQGKTLVSASTLDEDVKKEIQTQKGAQEKAAKGDAAPRSASTKSVIAAKAVGVVLGRKAQAQKVEKIVFDRNGFLYAGRVQAVADGAREAGLKF